MNCGVIDSLGGSVSFIFSFLFTAALYVNVKKLQYIRCSHFSLIRIKKKYMLTLLCPSISSHSSYWQKWLMTVEFLFVNYYLLCFHNESIYSEYMLLYLKKTASISIIYGTFFRNKIFFKINLSFFQKFILKKLIKKWTWKLHKEGLKKE